MTINDMTNAQIAYMRALPASLSIEAFDAATAAYAAGWTAATKRCTEEMATLVAASTQEAP